MRGMWTPPAPARRRNPACAAAQHRKLQLFVDIVVRTITDSASIARFVTWLLRRPKGARVTAAAHAVPAHVPAAMPPFLSGGSMITTVTMEAAEYLPPPQRDERALQIALDVVRDAGALATLRLTNTPASISRSIMVAQVFASAWVLNVRVCWGHPLRLIWACHWYGPFFLNVAIFNRTVPKLCHQSYRSTHGSRKTPANTGNLPRRAFAVQLHDHR